MANSREPLIDRDPWAARTVPYQWLSLESTRLALQSTPVLSLARNLACQEELCTTPTLSGTRKWTNQHPSSTTHEFRPAHTLWQKEARLSPSSSLSRRPDGRHQPRIRTLPSPLRKRLGPSKSNFSLIWSFFEVHTCPYRIYNAPKLLKKQFIFLLNHFLGLNLRNSQLPDCSLWFKI